MTTDSPSYGFVGLGAMGAPMVRNLLKAGLTVEVFDVRPEAVASLVEFGASPAASPAAIGGRCDVIGVCVVNDAQMLDVVSGPDGLLDGARPGTLVLLHSTVRPETCREVERLCRAQGVDVLEVTVSGYPDKAANGELTLMMGGEGRLVDRCDPYLAAVGDKRFLLGPVGAGSIAKLSNNVMAILGKLATFEGLQVARANGVDVDKMVEVAMVSTGYSDGLRQWKAQGLSHEPVPGSWQTVRLEGRRILMTALEAAREQGVDLPVVAAVIDLMSDLERE